MTSVARRTASLLLTSTVAAVALGGRTAVQAQNVSAGPDHVAINGYDPVAYFTDGQPMKGSSEFEYVWEDARWQFASAEHRDLFAASPELYAPQYGGYCSLGVAKGKLSRVVDPDAWTIVDGKLYLKSTPKDVEEWRRDVAGNIHKADDNWPGLVAQR